MSLRPIVMKSAEPAHQVNEDKSLPLIISTGVSATHAGAVLEQEHKFDGNIEPNTLEFYAKVFPSTNQVRLTFHRELKALYMGLKYSKFRIQGLTLIVKKRPFSYCECCRKHRRIKNRRTDQKSIIYDNKG